VKHIQATTKHIQNRDEVSIFLAGSIEMGTAEKWQDKIVQQLSDIENLVIFNPRRDDWDSSWVQSIDNPQFKEQVQWEQGNIEGADLVVFVFDPNTKSPITLMELGLAVGMDKYVIIYCPDGFWRKGNVDVLCENFGLTQVQTWEELIAEIKSFVVDSTYFNEMHDNDFIWEVNS
jgi:nucleoside 2-deoxyribosyltransferase